MANIECKRPFGARAVPLIEGAAQRLVKARQDAGYAKRESFLRALQRAGGHMSSSRLGKLERGETAPTLQEIKAICDFLRITSDYWLLGAPGNQAQLAAMLQSLCGKKTKISDFYGRGTRPSIS